MCSGPKTLDLKRVGRAETFAAVGQRTALALVGPAGTGLRQDPSGIEQDAEPGKRFTAHRIGLDQSIGVNDG